MYKLNGILLSNYGISPARAPRSNIALEGFLDAPKRRGKTWHSWSEEDGVEPYVLAEEILFDDLQIRFYAFIKGADRATILLRLQELYKDIGNLASLTEFSTPWGDFTGYFKEEIRMRHLGPGWADIVIPFTIPVPVIQNVPAPEPAETSLYHIDNIAFADFGAFVNTVRDNFNRAATKDQFHSNYDSAGYQITRPGPKEFTTEFTFYANSFILLKARVSAFELLVTSPGTRIINVDGLERECFNIEGIRVDQIQIQDNLAICRLTLPMMLADDGVPQKVDYLVDEGDNPIISASGKFIQIQSPTVTYIVDNRGHNIADVNFNPLIRQYNG